MTGDPGDTRAIEEEGLRRVRAGRYAGTVPAEARGGLLVLSEGQGADWRAVADGRRVLTPVDLGGVQGFALEAGDERVTVSLRGGALHILIVAGQLLLVLVICSLALRPPGTRRRRVRAASQPGSLTRGPDLLPREDDVVTPTALVERPSGGLAAAPATVDGGRAAADDDPRPEDPR